MANGFYAQEVAISGYAVFFEVFRGFFFRVDGSPAEPFTMSAARSPSTSGENLPYEMDSYACRLTARIPAMNPLDLIGLPDEAGRLDYTVREHEKLKRKFAALIDLLREKKVLSPDETARSKADEYV